MLCRHPNFGPIFKKLVSFFRNKVVEIRDALGTLLGHLWDTLEIPKNTSAMLWKCIMMLVECIGDATGERIILYTGKNVRIHLTVPLYTGFKRDRYTKMHYERIRKVWLPSYQFENMEL